MNDSSTIEALHSSDRIARWRNCGSVDRLIHSRGQQADKMRFDEGFGYSLPVFDLEPTQAIIQRNSHSKYSRDMSVSTMLNTTPSLAKGFGTSEFEYIHEKTRIELPQHRLDLYMQGPLDVNRASQKSPMKKPPPASIVVLGENELDKKQAAKRTLSPQKMPLKEVAQPIETDDNVSFFMKSWSATKERRKAKKLSRHELDEEEEDVLSTPFRQYELQSSSTFQASRGREPAARPSLAPCNDVMDTRSKPMSTSLPVSSTEPFVYPSTLPEAPPAVNQSMIRHFRSHSINSSSTGSADSRRSSIRGSRTDSNTTKNDSSNMPSSNSRTEAAALAKSQKANNNPHQTSFSSDHPTPNHPRTMIDVTPGCQMQLRGTDETLACIQNDFYLPVICSGCNRELCCIQDADYVLCPICRVVSPFVPPQQQQQQQHARPTLEPEDSKVGGVGLGFTMEYLAHLHAEILVEKRKYDRLKLHSSCNF